jgi:protein TonB
MPRDLFAQTLTPPHAPKRSRWTIVGSIFAHVGLIGALLIVPVLSSLDNFIVRANNALEYTLPAVAVPQAPPPASKTPAVVPDINPNLAPAFPPEKPVTSEVTVPQLPSNLFPPGAPPGTGPGGPGMNPIGKASDVLASVPPPVTPPPGPVRPGGEIKPPSRIAYTAPAYPAVAKSARIEGTVYLEATIDEQGIVRDVRVLRSIPFLDDAAKAAVSQWRYTPTKLNGVAVPVILTVTVTFTLR